MAAVGGHEAKAKVVLLSESENKSWGGELWAGAITKMRTNRWCCGGGKVVGELLEGNQKKDGWVKSTGSKRKGVV